MEAADSIVYTLQYNKPEELARISKGFLVTGGICAGFAGLGLMVLSLQRLSDRRVYEGTIVDVQYAADNRATLTVAANGENMTLYAGPSDPKTVGTTVRVAEDVNGVRKLRVGSTLGWTIGFGVVAVVGLYFGLSKNIPEVFYWPPNPPVKYSY